MPENKKMVQERLFKLAARLCTSRQIDAFEIEFSKSTTKKDKSKIIDIIFAENETNKRLACELRNLADCL